MILLTVIYQQQKHWLVLCNIIATMLYFYLRSRRSTMHTTTTTITGTQIKQNATWHHGIDRCSRSGTRTRILNQKMSHQVWLCVELLIISFFFLCLAHCSRFDHCTFFYSVIYLKFNSSGNNSRQKSTRIFCMQTISFNAIRRSLIYSFSVK